MNQDAQELTIFLDDKSSITVFFSVNKSPDRECVVIFSARSHNRQLGIKLPGTVPLLKECIDVVCVQSNCDDWHQNISLKGMDKLKNFLDETYSSIKGYGTSMGAFGAILYASKLNLSAVLALGPQYTIADDFDKRWRIWNEKISWQYTMQMATEYSGNIHLVYDSLGLDAKQAELIKQNFIKANVYSHPIKYGSHNVAGYLSEGGVLKKVLLSFVKNNIEFPKIEKNKNKTYLIELSYHLQNKNKLRWAKAVLFRSLELGDERYITYRQLSNVCHRLKDYDDAVYYAKKAVDAKNNNDTSRAKHKAHLVNMLRTAGRLYESLEIADG